MFLQKNGDINKSERTLVLKVYFLKLHICMYFLANLKILAKL